MCERRRREARGTAGATVVSSHVRQYAGAAHERHDVPAFPPLLLGLQPLELLVTHDPLGRPPAAEEVSEFLQGLLLSRRVLRGVEPGLRRRLEEAESSGRSCTGETSVATDATLEAAPAADAWSARRRPPESCARNSHLLAVVLLHHGRTVRRWRHPGMATRAGQLRAAETESIETPAVSVIRGGWSVAPRERWRTRAKTPSGSATCLLQPGNWCRRRVLHAARRLTIKHRLRTLGRAEGAGARGSGELCCRARARSRTPVFLRRLCTHSWRPLPLLGTGVLVASGLLSNCVVVARQLRCARASNTRTCRGRPWATAAGR